ncbi:MAG: hypothetical protein NWP80_01400 [Candidatus Gracilibacteria bacterium]|nr:hypothetical protein [Candidatus Gracilibacteria bacterium]
MNRRSTKNTTKTIKDYLAPIILLSIFSILLLNYLFSGEQEVKNPVGDDTFLTITLGDENSLGTIVYEKGDNVKISIDENKLYKTQKIKSDNGNIIINSFNSELNLGNLGELKYVDNNNFNHISGNLWVEAEDDIVIDMRFSNVIVKKGSVVSLYQTDVSSTIYVLDGDLEITAGNNTKTFLAKGEKLTILRDFSKTNTEVSTLVQPIDDFFKTQEWFIQNNGQFFLDRNITQNIEETNENIDNSLNINSDVLLNTGNFIQFDNLSDQREITVSKLDIEGTIISTDVDRIEINGIRANILDNKFSLIGFEFQNKVNDIVYRVYDINNNLLDRGVLTIYYSLGEETTNSSGLAQVQNYPIGTSTIYRIISPKENPYTTSEKVIRIEGMVPAGNVHKIVVNGFQLTKFPKLGTYWSYFANEDYGNLKDGINLYKIEYYGVEDTLLHEQTFTIIKKSQEDLAEPIIY